MTINIICGNIELQTNIILKGGYHKTRMITKEQVKDPKLRILTVCVRMFIEKGFKSTTMLDIIREADVSSGTFQNIFKTKDGVLLYLIDVMFKNQFLMARGMSGEDNPVFVYAAETAIQFAIVEMNENLREIYIEAYTQPQLAECIYQKTSTELGKIFGKHNPTWNESDFYESEIGSAGIMRAYMVKKCDKYFTLIKKINRFLEMALKCYNVPQDEIEKAIAVVGKIDLEKTAKEVMNKLFSALEMAFGFKFNYNEEN